MTLIHGLDCPCIPCQTHGLCEDCGERPAGAELNVFLCESCAATWLDNYEPPEDDGGVSIAELSDRAYRERAELRKRD